jgi:hypothetical protein
MRRRSDARGDYGLEAMRVRDEEARLPYLFLDIDCVLLRRRHSGMFDGFELAPHCLEFLEWATAQFRCRWLSSRCRQRISRWLTPGLSTGRCPALRSSMGCFAPNRDGGMVGQQDRRDRSDIGLLVAR